MPKMIQIRHVPDDVHETLKARAADAGMSLSDYLLAEITRSAHRPTVAEVIERLRALPPLEVGEDSADIIRRGRDAY
jgi:plasmid stability protein